MPETISDRLCKGLQIRGWAEASKRGGYRVWTHHNYQDKMFVGSNGALRRGSAPSNSKSLTGGEFYKELLGTNNLPSVELKL